MIVKETYEKFSQFQTATSAADPLRSERQATPKIACRCSKIPFRMSTGLKAARILEKTVGPAQPTKHQPSH